MVAWWGIRRGCPLLVDDDEHLRRLHGKQPTSEVEKAHSDEPGGSRQRPRRPDPPTLGRVPRRPSAHDPTRTTTGVSADASMPPRRRAEGTRGPPSSLICRWSRVQESGWLRTASYRRLPGPLIYRIWRWVGTFLRRPWRTLVAGTGIACSVVWPPLMTRQYGTHVPARPHTAHGTA